MTRVLRRRLVAGLVPLLLVLAGCVNVPTSGPVERVEGQQPTCQNCVNVEVAPPAPGDNPQTIVEGYLLANANFQPNYSVARQFLTHSAAQRWSADQGLTIYTGGPKGDGAAVKLVGRFVGALARDRTFSPRDQKLNIDFKLVREDGEWRISAPPPGLLVTKFAFDKFYERYNLYFVGSAGALVPDAIYLPDLRAPANIASALVKGLLRGPSHWLAPAVRTAVPPSTTLSVDSVTISDGVAQVPLSEAVASLPEADRILLAAQMVYTLKQVIGVKKVQLQVEGRPLRLLEGQQESDLAVPIDQPFGVDPVPAVASEDLYLVRRGSVQRIANSSEPPQVDPLPVPLGRERYDVDSLAVSVGNGDLAMVTDGGTALRAAPTAGNDVATRVRGASGLLRPQFTRNSELWAVGTVQGRQRIWVFSSGKGAKVTAPIVERGTVLAFRVSPDGSRIALLVREKGKTRTTLGVARINRSDGITVDGWRGLATSTTSSTSSIALLRDVAWSDASTLLVLGAANPQSPYITSTVSDDAAEIETPPQSNDWDAQSLAVQLRTGTAVVVARDGRVFRNDAGRWRQLLDGVSAVAYPG